MVCFKEEYMYSETQLYQTPSTSLLSLPNMDFGPNSNFSYLNNSFYNRNPYILDILFCSKGVR